MNEELLLEHFAELLETLASLFQLIVSGKVNNTDFELAANRLQVMAEVLRTIQGGRS